MLNFFKFRRPLSLPINNIKPKLIRNFRLEVSNNDFKFNFYDYKPSSKIESYIEKTIALKKEVDTYQSRANNELKAAIHKKLKLLWTYHSNAIEGSTLTLSDTIFFLENGLTVTGKPFKDFLDARNHAQALDYLYHGVTEKHIFTPYFMKELSAILLAGVSVKPMHVEPQMDVLLNWINDNIHSKSSIITSAIAHYNLARIHPFADNRANQILMNLILMKTQFSPAIIRIEDRKTYMESLSKANKGEFDPFIKFISNSLIETQELIISEIKNFQSAPANRITP